MDTSIKGVDDISELPLEIVNLLTIVGLVTSVNEIMDRSVIGMFEILLSLIDGMVQFLGSVNDIFSQPSEVWSEVLIMELLSVGVPFFELSLGYIKLSSINNMLLGGSNKG